MWGLLLTDLLYTKTFYCYINHSTVVYNNFLQFLSWIRYPTIFLFNFINKSYVYVWFLIFYENWIFFLVNFYFYIFSYLRRKLFIIFLNVFFINLFDIRFSLLYIQYFYIGEGRIVLTWKKQVHKNLICRLLWSSLPMPLSYRYL